MPTAQRDVEALVKKEYQHGFVTDIEQDTIPPGLNEDVVRLISAKKEEPEFMLQWRLEAFRRWQKMKPPNWAHVTPMADGLVPPPITSAPGPVLIVTPPEVLRPLIPTASLPA